MPKRKVRKWKIDGKLIDREEPLLNKKDIEATLRYETNRRGMKFKNLKIRRIK